MKPVIITGLDIETTGLEQERGHRIIEVAALIYRYTPESQSAEHLKTFVTRINPQRPIDPGAQAVHGIAFHELAGCPLWEDVAPTVVKILSASDYIVAHNGEGFDMPFVGMELLRIGQPVPNAKCVDTMLRGRWATPNGKVPNLGELCFACGVEYDKSKAHAAEYDVLVMMKSFFHALGQGFIQLPSPQ